MDYAKEIAELETLVRMVATAARMKHAYTAEMEVQRRITIWRQATYTALESAHIAGYDAAQSQIAGDVK
jgi:hypothetical protein